MPSTPVTARIPWHRLAHFHEDYMAAVGEPVSLGRLHESFQVYSRRDAACRRQVALSRSDYFKVTLITEGTGVYHYGEQTYHVAAPMLLFTVPERVKAWESTSDEQDGYFCVFSEDFLPTTADGQPLHRCPLFREGAAPVLALRDAEIGHFRELFAQMQAEYYSEHPDRAEALQLYLRLLLLAARRVQGQRPAPVPTSSAAELAERFLDGLAAQFPILGPDQQITRTTNAQFADWLAVHPNYLNACVKRTTGHTVSEHIRQHVMREATRLLTYTTWPVGWIAATLGFHDAAYFSRAFKEHTGRSPRSLRSAGELSKNSFQ